MSDDQAKVERQKAELRAQAHATRQALENKDERSAAICDAFVELPEYGRAKTVLLYLHVRAEVRTSDVVARAFAENKRVVVPYCTLARLELFWLKSLDELARGQYEILEPRSELRALPERRLDVRDIDLAMVPGVAFDRRGGRLGHGVGYYDKLLAEAPPETPLIGLAFECQVLDRVPMGPHDVFMAKVLTENNLYESRRR